ncbi:hypothetical protein [Nostoc sp.]
MQDPKLDVISVLKLEKRLQVFVGIYLSIVLLVLIFVLVKIPITSELQSALIIILGLITIATLDAFRKALGNTSSSLINEFKQIIVQDGGYYVAGNVDGIDKRINVEGGYVASGAINYGYEKRQTLAEAAAEIQDLLQQLEKSNPTASEAEIVAYVNEEIEPDLKSRLVKALKAAGEAAIESSLDSHYVNLIRAISKGWSSSE